VRIQTPTQVGYDAFTEKADAEVARCRGQGEHDRYDEQCEETRVQCRRIGVSEAAVDHQAYGHRHRERRQG
jgi:hypothetical protein